MAVVMSEQRWLRAKSPLNLLLYLKRTRPGLRTKARRRKARLFAWVCLGRVAGLLDNPDARALVEAGEQHAEAGRGLVRPGEQQDMLQRVGRGTNSWALATALFRAINSDSRAAAGVWRYTARREFDVARGNTAAEEKRWQAAVARCLLGNPFRPVALDPDWRTSAVLALAEGIYADRTFDRLPVLADALDDADCDQPDLIGHLRGPGPHARGCWVVDLVLGKS